MRWWLWAKMVADDPWQHADKIRPSFRENPDAYALRLVKTGEERTNELVRRIQAQQKND